MLEEEGQPSEAGDERCGEVERGGLEACDGTQRRYECVRGEHDVQRAGAGEFEEERAPREGSREDEGRLLLREMVEEVFEDRTCRPEAGECGAVSVGKYGDVETPSRAPETAGNETHDPLPLRAVAFGAAGWGADGLGSRNEGPSMRMVWHRWRRRLSSASTRALLPRK